MKIKLLIAMVLFPVSVLACGPGCFPYKDTCACDIKPETAVPVEPSNEKPPTDKMPSYEREGVTLATAANMADVDENTDKAKASANAEGKKAAGIQ